MDRTTRSIRSKPGEPNLSISAIETNPDTAAMTRRGFLSTLGAAGSAALIPGLLAPLAATLSGCQTSPSGPVAPLRELTSPPLGRDPFNLLEVAGEMVRVAEASRPAGDGEADRFWGRIGGSRAEAAAGGRLEAYLRPWVHAVGQEGFPYEAARPDEWRVVISGTTRLASAMPAPVSARFPDGTQSAPLQAIREDGDWKLANGRWAYIPPRPGDNVRRNPAREAATYERAVRAGAAGLIFALPTPPGVWRCAIQPGPGAPTVQTLFGTDFHPIPCFCVDAEDGARLEEAARGAADLQARIVYEPLTRRNGTNVVALLRAGSPGAGDTSRFAGLGSTVMGPTRSAPGPIAFLANLDGFFSGAAENASGLATLVGLAQQLALGPRLARRSDVYFVGLSAQNDGGAGLRAFAAADPARFASIRQFYFLSRTEAAPGEGPGAAQAVEATRIAFLGDRPWSALAEALPQIHAESGLAGASPQIAGRLAGIEAVAEVRPAGARVFCLDQLPPYAFTDHDTMDRLTAEGLERAVDFHLRVIETAGAMVPGTHRPALRTGGSPASA